MSDEPTDPMLALGKVKLPRRRPEPPAIVASQGATRHVGVTMDGLVAENERLRKALADIRGWAVELHDHWGRAVRSGDAGAVRMTEGARNLHWVYGEVVKRIDAANVTPPAAGRQGEREGMTR